MDAKFISSPVAVKAAAVPGLMDEAGIEFNAIACANWKEDFPYIPDVRFRIAHTGNAILLHYVVDEEAVRARYTEDDSPVWTDSCVEFFFSPIDDGTYYNLECNCAGTLLLGGGAPRPAHERAGKDVTGMIDRWSSLPHEACETRAAHEAWQVAMVLPVEALFKHDIKCLKGMTARANFYKCGDELPRPHFLSWAPIKTGKPNFHCPEFFGTLSFT